MQTHWRSKYFARLICLNIYIFIYIYIYIVFFVERRTNSPFAIGFCRLSLACSQAESAWRHHRQNIGATGRSLSGSYETEYWKFIQSRFVGVWRHVVASFCVMSFLANLTHVDHCFMMFFCIFSLLSQNL